MIEATRSESSIPGTPAAQVVFDTCELLENIIFHLGAQGIVKVTRVSKTWQAIINQSVQIQDARSLSPIPDDSEPGRVMMSQYIFGSSSHTHPILKPSSRIHELTEFTVPHVLDDTVKAEWDTYATMPPVKAISISQNGMEFHSHCDVYVKGGVRVGDLVDTARRMNETRNKFNQQGRIDEFGRDGIVGYMCVESSD